MSCKYELYYGDSEHKEYINTFQSEDEAFDCIVEFLKSKGCEPYYYRWIYHEEYTMIDYGSHYTFYYIYKR